jgi:hypothetical protein
MYNHAFGTDIWVNLGPFGPLPISTIYLFQPLLAYLNHFWPILTIFTMFLHTLRGHIKIGVVRPYVTLM